MYPALPRALPDDQRDSALTEALQAIADLDLTELQQSNRRAGLAVTEPPMIHQESLHQTAVTIGNSLLMPLPNEWSLSLQGMSSRSTSLIFNVLHTLP
jgi:hypothetical protein